MASRNEAKVQEGVKFLAAGDKCLQTGLFKWKPDHEGAAQAYKDAANCFKVARAHEEAKSAYAKAGKALESCGSDFHAAKYFEQAAMMAKEIKQGEEAAKYFEKAGLLFRINGSIDTAGIMLDRAGKILEALDGSKALEMYMSAADLSEDSDKLRQAAESLARAVQLMVKYRRFEDCVKAMEHQLVLYDKLTNFPQMHKVSLSIILVQLCRDDYVAAERYFRTACGIDGFGESDAAALAEELLQAYDSGDTEAMEKTTSDQYFSFISTEVARLARALRGPQDLAPPDPTLVNKKATSLPAYKSTVTSSSDAPRSLGRKNNPARAAEDRAALFGEAAPAAAPTESSHASLSAERAQPRAPAAAASAAPRMPAADERSALFGDSDKKPAGASAGADGDRSVLFASAPSSRPKSSEDAATPEPQQRDPSPAPGAEATPNPDDEAAGAAPAESGEKLFEDEDFQEGDLC